MRLIDADALLKQYKPIVFTAQTDLAEGMRTIIEDIENAPTVDAVPVVHGSWRRYSPLTDTFECDK